MPVLDSVVIGAGQAGLSASYHLVRRGIRHVVLDADDAPGGAWQHRWGSLTMRDVHGVAALPGAEPPPEAEGRANVAVPARGGNPILSNTLGQPITATKVRLLVVEADAVASVFEMEVSNPATATSAAVIGEFGA